MKLYLYRSIKSDTEEISSWIKDKTQEEIKIEDRFLEKYKDSFLPEEIAKSRVLSPYKKKTGSNLEGIIRYEKRVIDNPESEGGVLYDGFNLQRKLNKRIPEEKLKNSLHIILFDRALATWGDDGRWHKRINILGQPSLISIPGLYEAPAKPEEYYKLKRKYAFTGSTPPREILEEKIQEKDFLLKNDPRTTETLKGIVLQAIHFWKTGNKFCKNPKCKLYNAHKQTELIRAQLKPPEFCEKHQELYR